MLLETNEESNELCLQWVFYIPETMTEDHSSVEYALKHYSRGKGRIVFPGKEEW